MCQKSRTALLKLEAASVINGKNVTGLISRQQALGPIAAAVGKGTLAIEEVELIEAQFNVRW